MAPVIVPETFEMPPPVYSVRPSPPAGGRRILNIHYPGFNYRHMEIYDSNSDTPLYSVQSNSGSMFSAKPHIVVFNASTGVVIGSITFHSFSSAIDIQVHGKELPLKKASVFTSAYQFRSNASGGRFAWKRDGVFSGGDLKCTNDKDQTIAFFESISFAVKQDGKFEIGPNVKRSMMDELIVTGLAAVENQRRQTAQTSDNHGIDD